MLQTFSQEVRDSVNKVQHGFCYGCTNEIKSFHHKLHNFQRYWTRFPLFLHSPMNCVGLCDQCHMMKSHLYKITEREAEIYEAYLKKIKRGEI